MKILHKVLLYINCVVICFTIFSYLSPYINPAKYWFFSFFGIAFPWLVFANASIVLVWLGLKPKFSIWSGLTLIIGIPFLNGFYGISKKDNFQNKSELINIASFNIQKAYASYSSDSEESKILYRKFEMFLDTFKRADIFCAQETSFRSRKIIEQTLNFTSSHNVDGKGTAIYSRFPIVSKGEVDFGTKINSCIWADIAFSEDDTVRIYSVHLQSNRITDDTEKVVEEGQLNEAETWKGIESIFYNYRLNAKKRTEQVKMIVNHSKNSPYKIIICGDLNDPPQSFVYRYLLQDMKDSFREKGNGFGTTYAGVIPALRIDYIFVDDKINVLEHQIIKEKYSDHYPIVSTLELP